jgi:hypothetical protein
MEVLRSPKKIERSLVWNGCSYSIKNYGVEVNFNGMTSLMNFIKIYYFSQKLIGGRDKDTDMMVISLAYFLPLGRK